MEREQADRIERKLEGVLGALQENNTNQTKVLERIASHHDDTKRLHTRLDGVDVKVSLFETYHAADKEARKNFEERLKNLEDNQSKTVWLFTTSIIALAFTGITALIAYFTTHGGK